MDADQNHSRLQIALLLLSACMPSEFGALLEWSATGIGIVHVFGKGVGNASGMRQECVRNASKMCQNGSCLLGKRNVPKWIRNASKLRQKCVKNARNTFGGEHLWTIPTVDPVVGYPFDNIATRHEYWEVLSPLCTSIQNFCMYLCRTPQRVGTIEALRCLEAEG